MHRSGLSVKLSKRDTGEIRTHFEHMDCTTTVINVSVKSSVWIVVGRSSTSHKSGRTLGVVMSTESVFIVVGTSWSLLKPFMKDPSMAALILLELSVGVRDAKVRRKL